MQEDKTANVVVAKPAATNETMGGGSYANSGSAAGLFAGNAGGSFGVGLSYNNKGTSLKGQITLVVPQAGGMFYVKSNSISSMATTTVPGNGGKTTTIYSKASIYEVLNNGSTVTIDGNVILRMGATDIPGTVKDQVGFTVLSSKDSSMYYSNNWTIYNDAWRTQPEDLATGFVTVN